MLELEKVISEISSKFFKNFGEIYGYLFQLIIEFEVNK